MFRKRLTLALVALAVVSLLQGGVAWWAIGVAAQKVERGRVASDILVAFVDLSANKQRLRTWMSQSLLDAGAVPQARDRLQLDMKTTLARLQLLTDTAARLDSDQTEVNPEHLERRNALIVLRRSIDELGDAMTTALPLPRNADAAAAWTRLTQVFDMSQGLDLRSLLAASIAREQAAVIRERTAADQSLALVRGLALTATATLALAALGLGLYFARALRRPLTELNAGTEALRLGNLMHRIPADRGDEFAGFAQRVNAMAGELLEHRNRETEQRLRLEELVQSRTTELQQALNTLEKIDARRRQLFADISHELRTPTTAIRGEAEIALRGAVKPVDEYQATLKRIVSTTQHLGIVIDDLLTIARTDIDTLTMHPAPIDVDEPLRDAIEQARALGREYRVRLIGPNGLSSGVQVSADAQRLRQLFTVVLDNAVQYSKADGTVRVDVQLVSMGDATSEWQLRIADDGIGINADELPRVFERNFRGEQARRHRVDGSGLGLPIAATLARAHGGRIEIESAPGGGTVATVTLPVLPPAITQVVKP